MKTIINILFIIFFGSFVQAAPTITTVLNNQQWDANSTWNLNRQPQNNDTIVISTGKTLILDHNVSLNNVYIKILGILKFQGGKLTLDATSVIMIFGSGSIIGTGNNEQIRLAGIHKYKGGEGTITGPAVANISSGSGFLPFTLPVRFLSFGAIKKQRSVELTWSTAEENNNSHFDIQRSMDGRTWNNVGVVFGNINAGAVNYYQFDDKTIVTGTFYYRLKQVDKDGNFMYSTVKTVHAGEPASKAKVYGSGKKTIFIEFNEQIKSDIVVRVFNSNGQAVQQMVIREAAYRYEIQLPMSSTGVYIVHLTDEKSSKEVKKVFL